jgi:hypothetical protein
VSTADLAATDGADGFASSEVPAEGSNHVERVVHILGLVLVSGFEAR